MEPMIVIYCNIKYIYAVYQLDSAVLQDRCNRLGIF